MEEPFVGRKREFHELNSLLSRHTASLIVIKGRRRIGKSRLVEVFAKDKPFYTFTGLPPTPETTESMQREEFARQLGEQFGFPKLKMDDWGDLFTFLAKQTAKGRVIILLDEISWMGSKDPTFLGKLKTVWDTFFKKNTKLILILCGSVSTWIEKNILNSTGFFGRILHKITLEELSLPECHQLLQQMHFKWSSFDKCMLLGLTGGIPWYIELMDPKFPIQDNIKRLCFRKDGIFVDEFKNIFHDLFGKRAPVYKRIVKALTKESLQYNELARAINYPSGGPLSEYLDDLVISGFIRKDHSWNFRTEEEAKIILYRLRDNYLHFYLKYIEPNLAKIKRGQFENISIASFKGWNGIWGLQFEKLVLNNRYLIQKALKISPEDIVYDNPYFQRATKKVPGCQIDYLIQTKSNSLIACEIKFSRDIIKLSIVQEVKEKINRLVLPRGFSCCPVLIHIGEVSEGVVESNYFTNIINFEDLLYQ